MDDKLKDGVRQSVKEIEEIQANFDKLLDDLPGHTRDIQERTREALHKIRTKLDETMSEAENKAEDAQVQAHLGVMEAEDKLKATRKIVDDYLGQWQEKSKPFMDEATLQAHLASMEAKDFWERRGKALFEEFQQSQKTMESMAESALGQLQEQFGRWSEVFKDIEQSVNKTGKPTDRDK